MSVYLLIETRSEWESREVAGFLDLAGRLAAEGNDVDLFLVQNGVLNAKAGTSPALGALLGGAGAGVTVWVDDFSLSNRALAPSDLLPGPEVAGIGTLVDLLTRSGCKPIWHQAMASIFLGIMGAPYESELTTTLLRIVNEAIVRGHRVMVYNCGGGTQLTLRTLRASKPANMLDKGTPLENADYPSTARLIEGLIDMAKGRLQWYVCLPCMEERGALDQMDGVILDFPFKLMQCLREADVSMMMGVK